VRGLADIRQTLRDVAGHPVLVPMMLLAGAASFFVGNSYQAQMPGFAHDLGHGDPGTAYSMLLAADAAGALFAGILLESAGWLRASPRTTLVLAIFWCATLAGFAATHTYAVAIALLLAAGFFELSFSSMAQALVQLNAPAAIRGRVIGLFNMAALGMRAFSGITVGLSGSLVGIHWSLAASATAMLVLATVLLLRARAPQRAQFAGR
jgi:MFS family permease